MNDLTKVFINLNKCSAKEHIHIFSLLPSEPNRDAYNIFRGYTYLHFIPKSKYQEKEKWMVDRKVFDKTELTYDEFIKLFEDGEEESNGWIKVTESLPNRNDVVLTLTYYGKMDVCIFKEKDYWLNDMRQQHSNRGVVAWMLLPEPPKF